MRTKIKSGEELKQIALDTADKQFPELDKIQKLIFANGFMQGYCLFGNDLIASEQSENIEGAAV